MNKNLKKLREENKGYNPEQATNNYKIIEFSDDRLLLEPKEGDKTHEEWLRVHCETEEEFIILYSKTYGLIYREKYYVRNSDY